MTNLVRRSADSRLWVLNPAMRSRRPLLAALRWPMLCVALAAGTGGCVSATPVTPAPLAPERASELQSILPGKWLWMASSKTLNGPKDGVGGLYEAIRLYTFNANGTVRLGKREEKWSLDGANLIGFPLGTARVEEFSPVKLTLFIYDNSTFMYFERR